MGVLCIGEVLWDIFPDKELLGGAALNFCVDMGRLGSTCVLITAVGRDERGDLARERMLSLGVEVDFVDIVDGAPTGVAVVENGPDGELQFAIPRPAAFDRQIWSPGRFESLRNREIEWVYFGTLMQMDPAVEAAIRRLKDSFPGARCLYDINLREGHWNFSLVQRLCRMASILKMNEGEARTLAAQSGMAAGEFSLDRFCKQWASTYGIDVICVTLGPRGCYVYEQSESFMVPGYQVSVCDTVGAGDAFAAAFLHGYRAGWPLLTTAKFANAVGCVVAGRPGATPKWEIKECLALIAHERAKELESKVDVADLLSDEASNIVG